MIVWQFSQDLLDHGVAIPFNKGNLREFWMTRETAAQSCQYIWHVDENVSREIALKRKQRRTINFLRRVSYQVSAGT
jgi:hypothetical protein